MRGKKTEEKISAERRRTSRLRDLQDCSYLGFFIPLAVNKIVLVTSAARRYSTRSSTVCSPIVDRSIAFSSGMEFVRILRLLQPDWVNATRITKIQFE